MPFRRSLRSVAKLTVLFYLLASGLLLASKPLGTDVSAYQPANIDWVHCKTNGIAFAYVKATESTSFISSTMASQVAGAKAQGIPVGLYHFARPHTHPNITGANSADTEAQYFLNTAGSYIQTGGQYLIPMLDWEDPSVTNVSTTILNQTTLSQWVNEWCYYVSNYAQSKGITMKVLVYSGTWYCAPGSSYNGGLNSTVTQWPNAMSGYPSNPNAQTGAPSTSPWSSFTIWQYADTNWSGGDSDVFNGTTNQLVQTLVIGGAGVINSQPSSRYADRGSSLTMRIGLTSPTGATYQWRFNGTGISGQTKSTLTLTNIQASNAGSYTVVIGGTPGTATSSNAVLTVFQPYAPVFSDSFDSNTSANWNVNTSSANNRVTFAYDYSAIGIPSAPNSSGGSTKGLRMEANLSAAAVAAVSCSPKNQLFGGNYRLHFDMWINVNGPLLGPSTGGGTGSTETLTAGVGTLGNRVEWNGSGSTADGVYFGVDGDGDVADTSTTSGDFSAFIGTTFQGATSGAYTAGNQTTSDQTADSYYQNVFPGGQAAPSFQQTTYAQETGTLAAGTVGLGWHDVLIDKNGSAVNWYIDGLKIASVSSASITASNIFVGYWDPFSSVSDNTNLSFGLVDNVRVEMPAVAPAITGQPASQSVALTSNATFSVVANGLPNPSFQWRFNGNTMPTGTSSILTLTNVQGFYAGSYSVVVSNVAGAVTSSTATLQVVTPPALTSQPSSQTVNVGANTSFLFTCTGTQPLSFSWTKDGNVIAGATDDRITINNAQLGDGGVYVGTVTNSAGAASTTDAMLTVVQMQTVSSGFSPDGTFQLTVSGAPGPGYAVDGSTNLIDWFNIALLTNVDGTIQFTDSSSTNYPQLFYRVSAPSN